MREEKKEGGNGWETIKWKKRLYEDVRIERSRAPTTPCNFSLVLQTSCEYTREYIGWGISCD